MWRFAYLPFFASSYFFYFLTGFVDLLICSESIQFILYLYSQILDFNVSLIFWKLMIRLSFHIELPKTTDHSPRYTTLQRANPVISRLNSPSPPLIELEIHPTKRAQVPTAARNQSLENEIPSRGATIHPKVQVPSTRNLPSPHLRVAVKKIYTRTPWPPPSHKPQPCPCPKTQILTKTQIPRQPC